MVETFSHYYNKIHIFSYMRNSKLRLGNIKQPKLIMSCVRFFITNTCVPSKPQGYTLHFTVFTIDNGPSYNLRWWLATIFLRMVHCHHLDICFNNKWITGVMVLRHLNCLLTWCCIYHLHKRFNNLIQVSIDV